MYKYCNLFIIYLFATQSRVLTTLGKKGLENIEETGEIVTRIFSFSNNVFCSIKVRNHHFIHI